MQSDPTRATWILQPGASKADAAPTCFALAARARLHGQLVGLSGADGTSLERASASSSTGRSTLARLRQQALAEAAVASVKGYVGLSRDASTLCRRGTWAIPLSSGRGADRATQGRPGLHTFGPAFAPEVSSGRWRREKRRKFNRKVLPAAEGSGSALASVTFRRVSSWRHVSGISAETYAVGSEVNRDAG